MIGESSLDAISTFPFAYSLLGGLYHFIQALFRVFDIVWGRWLYFFCLFVLLYDVICCQFGLMCSSLFQVCYISDKMAM